MEASDQSEAGIQLAAEDRGSICHRETAALLGLREFLSRNETKQQQLMMDEVEQVQGLCWTVFKTSNQENILEKCITFCLLNADQNKLNDSLAGSY